MWMELPGDGAETVLLYGHLDKQPPMDGLAARASARGRRWCATASSTAAAAPTTATRPSPASPRCRRCSAQRVAARALRGADRGVRGERQLRPAGLHRGARRAHRHAEPRRLPRFRLRQLRPALDHDVAARTGRRHADASRCSTRACTPAAPAASCRRPSASCAQLLARLEDAHTGAILPQELHVEIPRRAPRRRRTAAAQVLGAGGRGKLPVRRADAAGGRRRRRAAPQPHLAAAARGHRRRRPAAARRAPATCCARSRR